MTAMPATTHILSGPERLTEGTMVQVIGEVYRADDPRRGRSPQETARQELPRRWSLADISSTDAALTYWGR